MINNNGGVTTPKDRKSILLVIMTVFLTVILSGLASASTSVVRDVSTTSTSSGYELEITLKISDMDVGGIAETIPEGYTYVSTTHPSEQTEVDGQSVIFSVLGESEITYTVTSSKSGSGDFEGVWDNSLEMTNGKVTDKSDSGSSSSGSGSLKKSKVEENTYEETGEITTDNTDEASGNQQDRNPGMASQDDGDAGTTPKTTDPDEPEANKTPFIGALSVAMLVVFGAFVAKGRRNNKGGMLK